MNALIKKSKPNIRLISFFILLIILLLGSYLRLYRIRDYLTFLGDEGRDVLVVKRMIVDHKPTLLGPTASVGGFFLGPVYYYLMAPFLWIFQFNPEGPAVMVALFGIATIYLVYLTGKNFFDQKTGLIAALLYCLSPVVINYSRSSWNPNLVPFFSLLIILITRDIIIHQKWNYFFWLGILFGIAFQLHYIVSLLFIVVSVYFLITSGFKKIPKYLMGLLGLIIGISPLLIFEIRHQFPNSSSMFKFLTRGNEVGGSGNFFQSPLEITLRLFTRLIAENNQKIGIFLLFFSLIAFFYCFIRIKKIDSSFKTFLLIICWAFGGIFLFGFYNKEVYDYYLGFLFPLPFLLTGHFLSHLSSNIFGKIIALIIIAYLVIINWQARPFKYEPNRQLDQAIKISRFVIDKTENLPFNFALITGQNSDHAYRYFFEIWGNKPVVIENMEKDKERKTVTSQLLIVCEKIDCQPLGHSLWEVAGFGRAEIAGEWDLEVVKIYKLIPYRKN